MGGVGKGSLVIKLCQVWLALMFAYGEYLIC